MSKPLTPLKPGNYYHIYNRGINSCRIFNADSDYEHFLDRYKKLIDPVADTIAWVLMPNHFHFLVQIKENVVYKYTREEISKSGSLNKWETISLPDGVSDPSALRENVGKTTVEENVGKTTVEENVGMSALRENVGKTTVEENVGMSALRENDKLSGLKGNIDSSSKPANVNSTFTSANADRSSDPVRLPDPTKHFSHLFNAYSKYYNKRYNRHGALFERPFKRKLVDTEDYLRQLIIYIHNNPVNHGFDKRSEDYRYSSYLYYLMETNGQLNEIVNAFFGDKENFIFTHHANAN